MPDTFYVPMPRSPATELADDMDHLETSIPVLNTDVFPDAPNLATIGAGLMSRTVLESGTATAAGASTLTDDTQTWDVDAWIGQILRIISGTGAGQRRIVESNDADTITVTVAWDTEPDATSDYDVVSSLPSPVSETILYTGKAVGALTGCTRSYEPEFSSQAWPGGTPVSRVLTAQDIRSLQNRVLAAEGDITDLDLLTGTHTTEIADLQDLLAWYQERRIWGSA
jgi:hypothetical protein